MSSLVAQAARTLETAEKAGRVLDVRRGSAMSAIAQDLGRIRDLIAPARHPLDDVAADTG